MTAAVNKTRFIVIFIFSGTFSAPRWWACWCWLPLYYIWIDKNIIHLSSFITIKRFSEIRNSKQAFKGVTVGQSDNCTGPSLTYIKINVPQSNITWPNKSNIVTVTVFGNLYEEENAADRCGEASVLPPVIPSLRHISIIHMTGGHWGNTTPSSSWRVPSQGWWDCHWFVWFVKHRSKPAHRLWPWQQLSPCQS